MQQNWCQYMMWFIFVRRMAFSSWLFKVLSSYILFNSSSWVIQHVNAWYFLLHKFQPIPSPMSLPSIEEPNFSCPFLSAIFSKTALFLSNNGVTNFLKQKLNNHVLQQKYEVLKITNFIFLLKQQLLLTNETWIR